jgi:hypothetical protein
VVASKGEFLKEVRQHVRALFVVYDKVNEKTDDGQGKKETDPDIERFEAIACCCPKCHHLGTRVGDADLEVTIRVLLFEDDADGLLNVDEETSWWAGHGLLVMRHAPCTHMPVFLKGGDLFGVVTMEVGLGFVLEYAYKIPVKKELTWLYVRERVYASPPP